MYHNTLQNFHKKSIDFLYKIHITKLVDLRWVERKSHKLTRIWELWFYFIPLTKNENKT